MHVKRHIVIIGAGSEIALGALKKWLQDTCNTFTLFARTQQYLKSLTQQEVDQLTVRSVFHAWNADDTKTHEYIFKFLGMHTIDILLIAFGILPEEKKQYDSSVIERCMQFNAILPARIIMTAADKMQTQSGACIAVITSIAGVRVRASNYLYGASKASLSAFIEGIRASYAPRVRILDCRPGLIDTVFIRHIKTGFFAANAIRTGNKIATVCMKKRKSVMYVPGWWGIIAVILRCLPRSIFHRIKA